MKLSNFVFSACITGLLVNLSCGLQENDPNYYISGSIDSIPADGGMVIMQQFDPISQASVPLDTATIDAEGKYELIYQLEKPDLFKIHYPGQQSLTLIIDEGQNHITLNVEGKRNGNFELKGSDDANLLFDYEAFRQQSYNRLVRPPYIAMSQASKAGDQMAEIAAVEEYVHNSKLHRQELLQHTKDKIGTSISLYGTVLRWTGDEEITLLEDLVENFKEAHPDSYMNQVMSDKVARYKKVAIGAKIPELIEKTPDGQMLDFNDAKGKYTLIDFWASWCRPCLLQVPDLKEAHAAFSDKGFQIVGVSLDYEAPKWKDAIDSYELNWPHISDVQGWQSKHAANFNVTFVPFNMLVDSEGKIIAKNLHSKALYQKLDELLSES